MTEFRDQISALGRLRAYYKSSAELNDIPFKVLTDSKKTVAHLNLIEDEYVISILKLEADNQLVITSRRLIILKGEDGESITHFELESISGVYLEFPYKKENPPHFLSILINEEKIIKLKFPNLESLVQARNEIHKVLNIVLLQWKGADFVVEKVELIPNISIEIIS